MLFEALEPRILLAADLDLLGTTALTSTLGTPAASPAVSVDLQASHEAAEYEPYLRPFDLSPLDTSTTPVVAGTLEVPGETDRFAFTLTEARELYFDSLTNRSDIRWSLVGPNGAEVSGRRFDQSDGQSFAGSPVLALEAGDYILSVDGDGAATGAYAFRLLDLAQSAQISDGQAVTGTLAEADFSESYRFNVNAGDAIFFRRDLLGGATGGGSPHWLLLGPSNEVVFDTAFSDVDVITFARGGRYTLLMEGPVFNTGAAVQYGFTLHRAATDTAALTLGATTVGRIEAPGGRDAYTFTLAGARRLVFDSLVPDSGKAWSLTGPRGAEVTNRRLDQSDAGNFAANPVLDLAPGDYTLTIDGTGASTGPYAFRLLDLANAAGLATGSAVNATLGDAGAAGGMMRVPSTAPLTYPEGATNRALQSIDTTNFVAVPDAATLKPAALTLEAWVRRDANAPNNAAVAMKSSSSAWNDGYGLYYTNDGFINFFVNNSSSVRVRAAIAADEWTHVAGTYDGAHLRLYRNGVQVDSRAYTAPISHSTAALRLGGGAGGDYPWRGALDEIRLWSVARSQAEIAASRGAPLGGGEAGLAGYWRFDEAGGAQVADASANGNNGSFQGFARETAMYRLDLARGDQILFDSTSGGSGVFWRLLDPSGQQLFGQNFGDVSRTIHLAGSYTLLVEGYASNGFGGAYGFTVVHQGNTPIPDFTGDPLTLGTRVDATISAAGEVDSYLFTTAGPARLMFDSLTNNGNFRVALDGPRGSEFSDHPMSSGDRLVVLPVAGTYRLRISGVGATTGAYAFRLLDMDAPTLIAFGETVIHTAAPNNGARVFAFDAMAGDRVFFNATQNNTWWTNWRLFDPWGREVFYTDFQDIAATLAHTGRYTLIMEGEVHQGGTGTEFRFRLETIEDTTLPLTLGAAVTGTIAGPGEAVLYTFSLAARSLLYFDARTNDSSMRWTLTGPAGTVVENRHFTSGDQSLVLGAGEYTLRLFREGDGTGAFAFRLADLAAAPTIAFGGRVTATHSPANSASLYRFEAAAGERVFLNALANNTWWTDWRLIDPRGRQIGQWDFQDTGPVTLELGGTWTLVLDSEIHRTGAAESYAFSLHRVVDGQAAIGIAAGNGSGPLAGPGVVDGAVIFTGKETASVAHGANTDLRNDVTIEFWLRYDRAAAQWTPLINKSDATTTSGANRTYSMWLNSQGYIQLTSADAAGQQVLNSAAGSVPRGEWVHVAGVLDRTNGQMRLLLNGVEVASGALRAAPAVTHGDPLRLGGSAEPFGWAAFEGAMDEVRLWSVARSNAAIAAGRNAALAGNEAGLALYLKMDEARDAAALADSGPAGTPATIADRHQGMPGLITGRIAIPGAVDRYSFTLAQDAWLLFDTLTDNDQISVAVTGPGGLGFSRNLRNGDQHEFGAGNPLYFAKAGTYRITVAASGDRTESYAFRLLDPGAATPIAFGEVVQGTLAPGNLTHAFRFDAVAGERLYFDLQQWSKGSDRAAWRLFDPSGRQIFADGLVDQGPRTLELTGRYTLVLEGQIWDPGDAAYRFLIQKVTDESTAITLGTNPAPGPYWSEGRFGGGLQFTGAEALEASGAALNLTQNLTFEAWVRPDFYAGSWTPLFYKGDGAANARSYSLWLRNDGAVYLGTRDAQGEQGAQTAPGQVPPGQWTHVAGVIDRASGQLRIVINGVERARGGVRAGNAVTSAEPLLIGRTLDANAANEFLVGRLDEVRVWSVARSTAEIAAAMGAPIAGAAAGLVMRLGLDEASGRVAADGSGNGNDAQLVSHAADGITGRIDHAGQGDSYSFTLAAETRLLLDVLTPWRELRFDLTGPRGTEASDWRFDSTDGAAMGGSRLLTLPAGTYTATVRATGDWTGWYSLRLLDLGQATPIAINTLRSGTLIPGSATHLLAFQGSAGQRVFFDEEGYTGSVHARLYDPHGQMLFGPTWFANLRDLGVRTLGVSGTYVLAVEGYTSDGAAQHYSVIVQEVQDETAPLTLGAAVAGAIDHRGQTDRYTFTLAAETRVVMDVLNDDDRFRWSLSGGGLSFVSDRHWQQTDSENFPAPPSILLPPGSYTLSVRGVQDTVGSYGFRLFALGTGTAIAYDSAVTGTLSPAAETDSFTFTGAAGERLWFDRESLSAGAPKVRVLDPLGRQVFGLAEFQDSGLFTLPMAGTYTLLVEGRRDDGGTITYGFALRREPVLPANGATTQDFGGGGEMGVNDGDPGTLPYALANWQGPPAQLIDTGSGNALRLTRAGVGLHRNSVGFSLTGAGPYQSFETTFDLRMIPGASRNSGSGDGMGFALLPTRLYGEGGRAPDISEEPNLAGALGIGFDIVNNGEPSGSNNHVSLHFNGTRLAEVAIPIATLDLAGGQFFSARVLVERAAGGSRVTLTLTPPGGGTPLTPFNRVFVGGLELESSRIAFGARNAGWSAHHDLDNVAVTTTAAAAGATSALPFTLDSATGSVEMLAATGLAALPTGHVWRHTVTLTEAKTVLVDWQGTESQPGWTLSGPDGVLAGRGAGVSDSWDGHDQGPIRLAPGTYEMAITGLPGTGSAYRFRLLDLATATPITPGTPVTGVTLNPGNETDLYRFTATAGARFFFDHLSGGFDAYWRLFDPDGLIVTSRNHAGGDNGPHTLAKTGSYVLAVEGRYYNTGANAYAFNLVPVTDDSAALTLGARVEGTIAHPGQVDRYSFTLTEAKTLYLDSFTNRSDIRFFLDGPNGVRIGWQFFSSADSFWNEAAFRAVPGAWTLTVYGDGAATGA